MQDLSHRGAAMLGCMGAQDLLRTGDVARRLGVNVSVARRWMASGHLPAVFVDGNWLAQRDDLDAWVESRRIEPRRRP